MFIDKVYHYCAIQDGVIVCHVINKKQYINILLFRSTQCQLQKLPEFTMSIFWLTTRNIFSIHTDRY